MDIKRKINEFHGIDHAADEVIIFGNPCTMQIISKHWADENLKSPAKAVNAPFIHLCREKPQVIESIFGIKLECLKDGNSFIMKNDIKIFRRRFIFSV